MLEGMQISKLTQCQCQAPPRFLPSLHHRQSWNGMVLDIPRSSPLPRAQVEPPNHMYQTIGCMFIPVFPDWGLAHQFRWFLPPTILSPQLWETHCSTENDAEHLRTHTETKTKHAPHLRKSSTSGLLHALSKLRHLKFGPGSNVQRPQPHSGHIKSTNPLFQSTCSMQP